MDSPYLDQGGLVSKGVLVMDGIPSMLAMTPFTMSNHHRLLRKLWNMGTKMSSETVAPSVLPG